MNPNDDIPFWTTDPEDRRSLVDQLCDWDNLILAYTHASKGKRGLLPVARFEYNLADNLRSARARMANKTSSPAQMTGRSSTRAWVEGEYRAV